ncbi:hypothetical protein ACQKMD_13495 [Viridibacillus sp. NPDC096237]
MGVAVVTEDVKTDKLKSNEKVEWKQTKVKKNPLQEMLMELEI